MEVRPETITGHSAIAKAFYHVAVSPENMIDLLSVECCSSHRTPSLCRKFHIIPYLTFYKYGVASDFSYRGTSLHFDGSRRFTCHCLCGE